jgi:hypothetical protein
LEVNLVGQVVAEVAGGTNVTVFGLVVVVVVLASAVEPGVETAGKDDERWEAVSAAETEAVVACSIVEAVVLVSLFVGSANVPLGWVVGPAVEGFVGPELVSPRVTVDFETSPMVTESWVMPVE